MKKLLLVLFCFIIISCSITKVIANSSAPENESTLETRVVADKSIILNHIEDGKYEDAKVLLLSIITSNNLDAEAYNLLGYTERQLQNFKVAINFYKKALEINENLTGAHHYIAMAYLELDNLESAKLHLNQLDLICLFGCSDFYEVKEKIALYEANYDSN